MSPAAQSQVKEHRIISPYSIVSIHCFAMNGILLDVVVLLGKHGNTSTHTHTHIDTSFRWHFSPSGWSSDRIGSTDTRGSLASACSCVSDQHFNIHKTQLFLFVYKRVVGSLVYNHHYILGAIHRIWPTDRTYALTCRNLAYISRSSWAPVFPSFFILFFVFEN